MASFSELASIYLALVLHSDEMTVSEDKIYALIKAAGRSVEPLWLGLSTEALASVNIGSLICEGRYAAECLGGDGDVPPPLQASTQLADRGFQLISDFYYMVSVPDTPSPTVTTWILIFAFCQRYGLDS
ncbi:hypothetical protein GH733_014657 [Mirounga leonina]|nr:hypothetical protein GH733_014657 [Mirounga leonina]